MCEGKGTALESAQCGVVTGSATASASGPGVGPNGREIAAGVQCYALQSVCLLPGRSINRALFLT